MLLRTDAKKSAYLSKTSNDLILQEAWLKKYSDDSAQVYFIILNQSNELVGLVRLYDNINDSFCWGSWILKNGVPSNYAIESALLVYHFALTMGFKKAHFDVRIENQSVWKFHERFGATRTGETRVDYLYNISFDAIKNSLRRYDKYLPKGFTIILNTHQ